MKKNNTQPDQPSNTVGEKKYLGKAYLATCEEITKLKTENEALKEANKGLLEAMQGFIDNVIHDKKVYDNQLSYYKGIFRTAISKHSGK